MDITAIAQEIQKQGLLPNITEIEHEGKDCVRIDWGKDRSLWLYSSGSIGGMTYLGNTLGKFLKAKGFKL
jgi:hypothetical protein